MMNKLISLILICFLISIQNIYLLNLKPKTWYGLLWMECSGKRFRLIADSALLKIKEAQRDSAGTSSKFWNDTLGLRRKICFRSFGIP